jgi:hypothetical protein
MVPAETQCEYRMEVRQGDIVLMPNGTVGIVTGWHIIEAGHVKEVTIHPFTGWLHRFFLFLTMKTRIHDEQINLLTPLIRSAQ